MTKRKPLHPFHFMVYATLDDNGQPVDPDVVTINAYDVEDAYEQMHEFGTPLQTNHTTSLPRFLAIQPEH
jgi:hypothetical protein